MLLAAASQDWPPFVLVAGLLLVGLAAAEDGLFAAAGGLLARSVPNALARYAAAMGLVALVTAVLNLDTSVAFLTPVLVHAARSRGDAEGPLLYGSLMLSNASSLLLPGANLTNLIVLGQAHLSGADFVGRMAAPAVAAALVTAAVVAVAERGGHRGGATPARAPEGTGLGPGLVGVLACAALVLLLSAPALPVLGVGLAVTGLRLARRETAPRRVLAAVGVPSLAGLFAVAVALGTLARNWSGPARLMGRLGEATTALVAALASVAVNNLPAASLLSAQPPRHPFALLVGLNLGPNLCVTGSLAWLLWLRAARSAGAEPSLRRASRIGAAAVPLSLLAAVGALAASR